MRINFIAIAIVLLYVATSCKTQESKDADSLLLSHPGTITYQVDTETVAIGPFSREIVSNGIVNGVRHADIRFYSQGIVEKVYIRNGSRVRVGDTLAKLNTEQLEMDLSNAESSLEKAYLDLQDYLIRYGSVMDTSAIAPDVLKIAKIRSGYNSAATAYKHAKINLENAVARAPFGGVVTDVQSKAFEQSTGTVCTIIDDSSFDVTFQVLESELPSTRIGNSVKVSTFNSEVGTLSGIITEINPKVNERGQIMVKAHLSSKIGLIDGMSVKVTIESTPRPMMSVPKSAVLTRDGNNVLFAYDPKTSTARRVYVNILESNSQRHAICVNTRKLSSLDSAEIVIIRGNLNLTNGSKVEIYKQE